METAAHKRYRERHPDRVAANIKRWDKAHPERKAFHRAKNRCTNPNNKDWNDYGGRGIQFLFTSFEQFFAEIGKRPAGKTLDRRNNDGHYEPGNVRWATRTEQNLNRRKG